MKRARMLCEKDFFACAGLPPSRLRAMAYETGFCQRASGKIDAPDFLVELCVQSAEGTVSYNDLAARMEARTGVSASRQAYWERTGEPCVRFFQSVLESILLAKCRPLDAVALSARFGRVLVQDSTIVQLPLRLFSAFSGVRNAAAAVCNARIQGVYDLLCGRFVCFRIDPYSRNDLAAALDIEVRPGDLILRDRGYFQVSVFAAHARLRAHTLSRYKHPTTLYDPDTGEKLDLIELLNRFGSLDRPVLADAGVKLPLRLVAIPVSEETANQRRRKAHKDIKGRVPSKDILSLMSWTIFLTTITDPAITPSTLLALYGLRWRIESIFKTWKGNFNFAKIHNVSQTQLRVLLYARLIVIALLYERLFLPLDARFARATGRHLSLMKFARYVSRNLLMLTGPRRTRPTPARLEQALRRFCAYDKRRRPTFAVIMDSLFLAPNAPCALA